MIFLIFLLISVEEDRDIPSIFPDYADSLPVLYPSYSVKTKFAFAYGYPVLFFTEFENNYIKVLLEKGQDIDKYMKYFGSIKLNTHWGNFQFLQSIEVRNNTSLLKPLLKMSLKWRNLGVIANASPSIIIYSNTMLNSVDSITTGDSWDTLSIEYINGNFLFKPFISLPEKGIIIQFHNKDKGIRIKLENSFSSRNIGDIIIGEIGYFSPLFYVRIGKESKNYLDTLVYIPFIYPNFSYILQDYIEIGFLFLRLRAGRFNSVDFDNYDAFTPQFYNNSIQGLSFFIHRGDNALGIFLGRKDTINISGLKINTERMYHRLRFSITGYAGYFSDTGWYGRTNLSFMLNNRFSPVIKIENIHFGEMMGKKFLPISVYAGIKYEGI